MTGAGSCSLLGSCPSQHHSVRPTQLVLLAACWPPLAGCIPILSCVRCYGRRAPCAAPCTTGTCPHTHTREIRITWHAFAFGPWRAPCYTTCRVLLHRLL